MILNNTDIDIIKDTKEELINDEKYTRRTAIFVIRIVIAINLTVLLAPFIISHNELQSIVYKLNH